MKFQDFIEKKEGLAFFSNLFETITNPNADPNEFLPAHMRRKGQFRNAGEGWERGPSDPKDPHIPYNPRDIKGDTYGEDKVAKFLDILHQIGQRDAFSKSYDAATFLDKIQHLPEVQNLIPPLRRDNSYQYLAGLLNMAAKNRPGEIVLHNNKLMLKDPGVSGKFYKKPANQMIGDEETGNRNLTYGVVPPKNLEHDFNPKNQPIGSTAPIISTSKIPHAALPELKSALQQASKSGDFKLSKTLVREIKDRAEGFNPITGQPYDDKQAAEELYMKILDSDKYKVFA